MNMKKTCKRFLRLGRGAEGFTLVELIVVIAILAILAGVAVPVYSTYVEQANKQADITLVSEVESALLLYYYSHSGEDTDGYVVITPEGKVCVFEGCGEAAMDAAFGDGWENNLSLSYDGWIVEAAGNTLTNVDAQTITDTVGSLTGLAGAASAANSNGTIASVLTFFCSPNGQTNTALQAELELYKDLDQDTYATVATNLMVKYLAEEIGAGEWKFDDIKYSFVSSDGTPMSSGANYAMQYAMLYAMANSNSEYSEFAKTQLSNFDIALQNIVEAEEANSTTNDVTDALEAAFFGENGLYSAETQDEDGETIGFMKVFQDYINANSGDVSDITSTLGAMSNVAADYNDLDTLSDANLFSSSAMTNTIKAYQKAAEHGGIAILIDDGVCAVMPKLS